MHPCESFLVVHPTHILVHPRVHRAHRLETAGLDDIWKLTIQESKSALINDLNISGLRLQSSIERSKMRHTYTF